MRDAEGRPDYYYSFLTDITDHKRTERTLAQYASEMQAANKELDESRRSAVQLMENALAARQQAELAAAALAESEHRLRALSDQIPGGAIYQQVQQPDGPLKFAYMSAGIERLFGLPVERVLADPGTFRQFVVKEAQGPLEAAERRSARELTPFDCEFRQRTATGKVKWVQCRSMPRRLEDGSILWDGVVVDITERKQARAELEKLAQQRQLALNAARMGWWHYDPVTREASWDDRYKEIFAVTGYHRPNDEILQRLHPDDLPGVWAKAEAALDPADPQPYSAQYRINLPDGSLRWIEAHGIAAFEGEGESRRATNFVGTRDPWNHCHPERSEGSPRYTRSLEPLSS